MFSPRLASQQVLPYEELCLHSGHNDDEDHPLAASSTFFAPIPIYTDSQNMEKALRMGVLFVQAWFCSGDK